VITNYHAFLPRELAASRGVSRLTKDVLNPGGGPSPFTETEGQIVARVLRDLTGSQEIVVFNDESHHCNRGKADDEKLTGTDRAEANERNEEARVWLTRRG
jgi:type III restriction enzyme